MSSSFALSTEGEAAGIADRSAPQSQAFTLHRMAPPHRTLSVLALVAMLFGSAQVAAHAQGGPPFRTDDPGTPGNEHVEINVGFVGDRNPGAGAYQVPDFDFNYGLGDRIQLKYEVPIAIEETRPQPDTIAGTGTPGQVIGGLGASQPGIKWRFYEHYPGDPAFRDRFGTGLRAVFGKGNRKQTQPAAASGDAPGAADAPEKVLDFSVSTYPQLSLNNPTRAVPRGLVATGPNFYLPLNFNGRLGPLLYNGEYGYHFGNRSVPQSWGRGLIVGREFTDRTEAYFEIYDQQDANRVPAGHGVGQFATGYPKQRETTLDIGGRQALNKAKTLNLLLMGGRSFQPSNAVSGQPGWIAYVGVQVLFGLQ